MKKGQKLKRTCVDCNQLKEQVKDRMYEAGTPIDRSEKPGWVCNRYGDARAARMWEKLMKRLPTDFAVQVNLGKGNWK